MWYTLGYANTIISTPAHGGRACNRGDRSPVRVRLYRPPLPEAPRQGRRPIDSHDCTRPTRHGSDGAQRRAYVSPTRPRGTATPIVPPPYHVAHRRRWGLRSPPGPLTPESTDVRPTHEPVDARTGRRGQFRRGLPTTARQRRHHAAGPPSAARVLEAGPTLDHPSQSSVCSKKRRRDQLIQRAMPQPTWALGCGDAGWWSRLAQPHHHGWRDPEGT
jgi:hypothetical protein